MMTFFYGLIAGLAIAILVGLYFFVRMLFGFWSGF